MFIQKVQAAGAIDDAPSVSHILLNVSDFLLQTIGIVGLIGFTLAGLLYFFANGDRKKIDLAKKVTFASIIGMTAAFSSWVIIKTIAGFFGA